MSGTVTPLPYEIGKDIIFTLSPTRLTGLLLSVRLSVLSKLVDIVVIDIVVKHNGENNGVEAQASDQDGYCLLS